MDAAAPFSVRRMGAHLRLLGQELNFQKIPELK